MPLGRRWGFASSAGARARSESGPARLPHLSNRGHQYGTHGGLRLEHAARLLGGRRQKHLVSLRQSRPHERLGVTIVFHDQDGRVRSVRLGLSAAGFRALGGVGFLSES